MRRTPNRPSLRAGFTLVELLVVMTIIAILFALTAAAVVKSIQKADDLKLRNDISQLQVGVQAFKTQFQAAYLADKIVLPPGYDLATAQYFSSLWPRLDIATLGTGTNQIILKNGNKYASVFAYWGVQGSQPVTLHGDQCLVYLLGGQLDASNNATGFSTDGTDPMKPYAAGTTRSGPFFEFPPGRLKIIAGSSSAPEVTGLPKRSPYQPSFVDVFGLQPYLYFSSQKAGNDYANAIAIPTTDTKNFPAGWKQVTPFMLNPTPRFANPTSFQIVAAGRDTEFGGGKNEWIGYAPGGAASMTGNDDIANFHPTTLGVPAN